MKLRYYLLSLFLFLSLAPLVLFRAWPHSEVLESEFAEVHERHLLLANNLAAALERYYRDLVTTFDLLVTTPENWSDGSAMKPVLANLSVKHICLANWETGVLSSEISLEGKPCPTTLPADKLARLQGFATSEAVTFGGVVMAPSGENVIHMVRRIGEELAFATIPTTYFRELGEAIAFGVKGHAAIVDQTGRALSHPLPHWVAERKDMSKISAVQRMLNGETGVEQFYSPALKGDMIAGLTSVEPVGWGVMIPQPVAELHEKADHARRSSIIVYLIGIVSALALAYLVSLRIVRPLEQLTSAASSIASGKFDIPDLKRGTGFLPTELRELKQRFREMVKRLHDNIATINALAYRDGVTNLGNRTYLQLHLGSALDNAQSGEFMLIDLDGFKAVNDLHGHDVGDKVLDTVARRLCEVIGISRFASEDVENVRAHVEAHRPFAARLGGDEFAVWIPAANSEMPTDIAADIVARVGETITINEIDLKVGASVGVARSPRDASDLAGLIKAADMAMYEAKKAGKDCFVPFTPELMTEHLELRKLGQEIEEGLANGEFVPHFQPQFRLPGLEVSSVEALVRWEHPERGTLPPAAFLELARDLNLLPTIDRLVLQSSVQRMKELHAQGHRFGALAVNLSEERMASSDFSETLDGLTNLPFELRFELMETMVLDKIEGRMAWTLDRIRESGFALDLDDFGAANASILGLMNVEPAHLKIDRNLVSGMADGNIPERLVRSIIEMGHSLDIPVIAEGADTMEKVGRLAEMRCDFVQGFALARPMAFAELTVFLESRTGPRKTA
ncbi:putative bifunctional diguanylate cyclase/phosphodiesterase [Amaricoccus macauensis]|uniref:putative bifunctional diguanylate cyclase/phosphodiesterase n=1 Tax=Amaricoccus macauensis TaxID=57001 RepID=UPI003C799680